VTIIEGNTRMIKYSYNEGSTPLFFRSILALTTNEDYSAPTYFDYSFWASDIIQTSAGPALMAYNPPNQFFIRRETKSGNFLGWTAIIATLVILITLLPGH
jgi:hypothetical protein